MGSTSTTSCNLNTVIATGEALVLNIHAGKILTFAVKIYFSHLSQHYVVKVLALCWKNPYLAPGFHQSRLQWNTATLIKFMWLASMANRGQKKLLHEALESEFTKKQSPKAGCLQQKRWWGRGRHNRSCLILAGFSFGHLNSLAAVVSFVKFCTIAIVRATF